MQPALLQERIADVVRFLILQTLALAERQARLAMRVPRGLEAAAGMAALAQREPDAVLDSFEVRSLADPGLARGRAANGEDARDGLAFLVGGDGCFPVECSRAWGLVEGMPMGSSVGAIRLSVNITRVNKAL